MYVSPQYNSEVDFCQGGKTQDLLNHGRLDIIETAHSVAGECIENRKDFGASVTLTEHRDHNRFGHRNVLLSVSECVVVSL